MASPGSHRFSTQRELIVLPGLCAAVLALLLGTPILCSPEQSCSCSSIPAGLVLQSPENTCCCWAPSKSGCLRFVSSQFEQSFYFPPSQVAIATCSPTHKMHVCLVLSYKAAGSQGALECTLALRFCSPKKYYCELSVYDLKMYLLYFNLQALGH